MSGNDREFAFLDIINVLSFVVGLMNLEENLTQGDKQDIMKELSGKTDMLLDEIHKHLEEQDDKIDEIYQFVKRFQNENT